MAKLDVYKLTGSGGGAGAVSPVAVHATRSNIKAFAGIQYSLKGIQSTLKSIERIEIEFIENDKLRDIAERRRKRREADRLAEERAEKGLGSFTGKASKGKLDTKSKKKVDSLFGKLFSGLEGLAMTAFKFLLKVAGLLAVKSTLEYFADEKNREKLVTFFRKASFVFNKIAGIVKFLVVDSLIEGVNQTFGKDKTFGERVGGLWKIITGIVGLGALLNPFGMMDAILSLLGLDFYRNKAANVAADVLDDVYIDGPDGQQRKYRKNPKTGRWEEIDPKTNRPVKPGTTKPGTTKLPTTKPGGNQIPKNQRLTPNQMASNLQKARLENQRQAKLIAELRAQNKTLLGRGTGSNIAGRGVGAIPRRAILKAFGKNAKPITALLGGPGAAALKAGVKTWASRVPWVGGIITAAIGLLDGDPIEKVAFETIGTLIGGAIGTAIIPIPILGSTAGMIAGQYAGDLAYMFFNKNDPRGGGIEGVKRKIIMDARDLWQENILPAFRWTVNALGDAGNFIQTSIGRMWEALPRWDIPKANILGIEIGGFKILDPAVLGLPADPGAAKKLFDQAFNHDKPVTPIKVDAATAVSKAFTAFLNFFKERQSAGQTGGRAAQKEKERERNRLRALQKAEEEKRAATLKTARDAFLEKFKIRAWDNTGNWRDGELAYKDVAGWFFGGTKEYYVRQEGGWNKVEMYGPLTRKNFNSDEAFNFFKLGGGNAQLKRNRYDVKEVVMRGFNAGTSVKKIETTQVSAKGSGQDVTTPSVTKTQPSADGFTRDVTRLLENYEGLRLNAYPDPASGGEPITIGVGATRYPPGFRFGRTKVRLGDTITKEEAYMIKDHDVKRHTQIAISKVGASKWAKLPDNVKFALISKAFNYGTIYNGALQALDQGIESGDYSALSAYYRNVLAKHNNGINTWRRGDEAGIIDSGKSARSGITFSRGKTSTPTGNTGSGKASGSDTTVVQPQTSFVTDTAQFQAPVSRAVGQKATLEGKPVIWDGTTWQPDPEGGSEDSPTKSQTTTPQDGRGYAILPYQSDPSDAALPFEQAKSIAEGILGKKYTAYDLGSVGGLKEGGLQAAIDAYKSGDGNALQSAFDQLSDSLGTGSSTGVPVRDTLPTPEPGEDGYAGPKSDINPLDYSDQSGLLKDNTGKTYTPEDILREIGGDPKVGPVNPDTYGGVRGFDLRDLFGNNRGLNPYGPDGRKADMWTNSTGWQDKIPGWGDYSQKIDYSPIGTFKSGSLDFSKAFGFSAGGKVPNNLKPFFIGGIFKGIKKAFSGIGKAISSVVSGVGNFLNSPLGSILTTAISFVPGFQWVAPVVQGFKAASAIAQGDILGAVTNTVGALTGFFPETMGNFFQGVTDTLGEGFGGVVNGFLQGGIGGAIGGIGGMLGPGVQKFLGGIGDFIKDNPVVGSIIKSIPGLANIPGLSNLFGLEEFPGMPGPIGVARTLAGQFGMGSLFDGMLGIAGMTQQGGLMQQAGELGVDPRSFGIFNNASAVSAFDPKGGISSEYAMQTALEFVPVPMILLKLVPIDRPVPINSVRVVRQPAKPAPPPPQK